MDYTIRWPQFGAGAKITLGKLTLDNAGVDFPPLDQCGIQNESFADTRLGPLLFGPAARAFTDLRDNPVEFVASFPKTSIRRLPVGLREHVDLLLFYDRDGVPSCSAFHAHVLTTTSSSIGDIDDEGAADGDVHLWLEMLVHYGRIPVADMRPRNPLPTGPAPVPRQEPSDPQEGATLGGLPIHP